MKESIKKRIEEVCRGEVPDGYRRTRAGLMPLEWKGNLAAKDVFRNHTNKKHNGEFEVLSATQDRGIIPRSEVDIDIKYDEENIGSYKKVEAGDFVISLRSFQGGIEYSEYEGLVSPAYTVLKATKPISDNYYRAYFKTLDFISRLNGAVYGIRDGKQIGFEDFGELAVHYPPLAEQQKIAEILATCDRVIELKQRLLKEKRRRKQWLMKKLLSETSGVNEVALSKLCSAVCDGDWIESKDQSESGIRLIQTGNVGVGRYLDKEGRARYISEDTFKKLNCTEVFAGNILLSRLPDPIGRACMVPNLSARAITAVDCTILRFKDADVAEFFLQYATSNEYFNKISILAGGSTRTRISRKEIEKLLIPVPTSKTAMQKISKGLSLADQEISALEQEMAAWQQKKKALMQLLLTGLVRVNA